VTLQPGNRLGNYEIIEKIGAGGMGAVYKGYQTALGRYVAIKVLPPQTAGDPSFAERFAQEAKAIGKLRHPNIVTAFDFAHDGDIAYLVSEFIDGGTLFDQLGAPLPLEYTVQLLTPVAAALDYAHARGIVHRDIKPQNILMTHDGVAVLTDFGLAKIVGPGSGMTQAGSLMGTAEYIAPECATGAEVAGPAADQYALGLIAYQMLVGRHPFPTDNPLSALMAHVHKPVPLPSTLGVALPPGTEAALLRALAKRPEERFARCGDLVRALVGSNFVATGPMATIPPTTAPASPSDPPTAPPTPAPEAVILSPSALVRPPESTPPTRPPSVPPAAPRAASVMFPARGAATEASTGPVGERPLGPPAPVKKRAPWWRTRKIIAIPGAIVLILIVLAQFAPREPAPTVKPSPSAIVVTLPATLNGAISAATESDLFRFQVPANKDVLVELRLTTLADGGINLLGPNGEQLASENAIGNSKLAQITYHVKDAGTYHVVVHGLRNATGTYQLAISAR
jgi:serine/threonine-protein kinase